MHLHRISLRVLLCFLDAALAVKAWDLDDLGRQSTTVLVASSLESVLW